MGGRERDKNEMEGDREMMSCKCTWFSCRSFEVRVPTKQKVEEMVFCLLYRFMRMCLPVILNPKQKQCEGENITRVCEKELKCEK